MSEELPNVELEREYGLRDGGRVEYYKVSSWSMEVVYDKDGVLDLDSDADLQYARQAAEAWKAGADFIENGGLEEK